MNKAISGFLFLSCLFFYSCKPKAPAPTGPTPVNLYTVKARQVVYYDRYPGTTAALSEVTLMPQVQGYITGIFFKEGAHVKKGQKLYEIDKRLYQANYQAAEANMQVAQGTLKQSKEDADRYTYLNENRAVAKQLYDHAVITLQNSQNQVKSAVEGVNTARTNLSYSVITSPFNGTIGFSQVKLGNFVNVGQTILNTVSTDDTMGVDFLINEKQLPYYEDLQSGKYNDVDSLFTLILPNKKIYPHLGRISVIDRAVDAQTGSIRVRVLFQNTDYYLRSGMSCVLRVRNVDNTPQMLIPHKAIVEQMGEYFVFVAKDTVMPASDSTAKGKEKQPAGPRMVAEQHKVHLGEIVEPNVVIRDGISEGDRIVVDGVQTLRDGTAITLQNKVPPAAKK